MEFENYSSFWNRQAATPSNALAAVDGSASEETVQRTGRWTAAQVACALRLDGTQAVLELGCGVGRIGRELAGQCRRWTGVDVSSAMLGEAAKRLGSHSNVEFRLLDKTSLSAFPADRYDRVYSVAVLCHMDKEDLFLYLQEIQRVLKPGGWCYLETWNLSHPIGWRRWRFEVDDWARSDQSQRKNVARNQFCAEEEFMLYLRHAALLPVLSWTDSPWIQAVAGKDLNGQDLASLVAHLESNQQRIVYSQQWGELFGQLLDVIYGVTPPGEMLLRLAQQSDEDREIALFKAYLLALWRQQETHWGAAPADS